MYLYSVEGINFQGLPQFFHQFEGGPVCIVGKNMSGKSTFARAAIWCGVGKFPYPELAFTKDVVFPSEIAGTKRKKTKAEKTSVTVIFYIYDSSTAEGSYDKEVKRRFYKMNRSLTYSGVMDVTLDEISSPEASEATYSFSGKEAQEIFLTLNKIPLHLEPKKRVDLFMRKSWLGVGQETSFFKARGTERKKILEAMNPLAKLSAMHKESGLRSQNLTKDLAKFTSEFTKYVGSLETHQKSLNQKSSNYLQFLKELNGVVAGNEQIRKQIELTERLLLLSSPKESEQDLATNFIDNMDKIIIAAEELVTELTSVSSMFKTGKENAAKLAEKTAIEVAAIKANALEIEKISKRLQEINESLSALPALKALKEDYLDNNTLLNQIKNARNSQVELLKLSSKKHAFKASEQKLSSLAEVLTTLGSNARTVSYFQKALTAIEPNSLSETALKRTKSIIESMGSTSSQKTAITTQDFKELSVETDDKEIELLTKVINFDFSTFGAEKLSVVEMVALLEKYRDLLSSDSDDARLLRQKIKEKITDSKEGLLVIETRTKKASDKVQQFSLVAKENLGVKKQYNEEAQIASALITQISGRYEKLLESLQASLGCISSDTDNYGVLLKRLPTNLALGNVLRVSASAREQLVTVKEVIEKRVVTISEINNLLTRKNITEFNQSDFSKGFLDELNSLSKVSESINSIVISSAQTGELGTYVAQIEEVAALVSALSNEQRSILKEIEKNKASIKQAATPKAHGEDYGSSCGGCGQPIAQGHMEKHLTNLKIEEARLNKLHAEMSERLAALTNSLMQVERKLEIDCENILAKTELHKKSLSGLDLKQLALLQISSKTSPITQKMKKDAETANSLYQAFEGFAKETKDFADLFTKDLSSSDFLDESSVKTFEEFVSAAVKDSSIHKHQPVTTVDENTIERMLLIGAWAEKAAATSRKLNEVLSDALARVSQAGNRDDSEKLNALRDFIFANKGVATLVHYKDQLSSLFPETLEGAVNKYSVSIAQKKLTVDSELLNVESNLKSTENTLKESFSALGISVVDNFKSLDNIDKTISDIFAKVETMVAESSLRLSERERLEKEKSDQSDFMRRLTSGSENGSDGLAKIERLESLYLKAQQLVKTFDNALREGDQLKAYLTDGRTLIESINFEKKRIALIERQLEAAQIVSKTLASNGEARVLALTDDINFVVNTTNESLADIKLDQDLRIGLKLSTDEDDTPTINLTFEVNGAAEGKTLPSESQRNIMSLVTDSAVNLLNGGDGFIFVDEPETGLDDVNKVKVAKYLQKTSRQPIVITNSASHGFKEIVSTDQIKQAGLDRLKILKEMDSGE